MSRHQKPSTNEQKLKTGFVLLSGKWKLEIKYHYNYFLDTFLSEPTIICKKTKQKKTINDSNTYTKMVKLCFDVIMFNRFINIV